MSTDLRPALLLTRQPARSNAPLVKARALTHLIFERARVDDAVRFLEDFGLRIAQRSAERVHLRAADASAYCYRIERASRDRFVGFGLAVESREELESVARVPGAGPIERAPHPGGGELVQLRDPSGFLVEVVCGQASVAPETVRAPLPLNLGAEAARINTTQRPPLEPATVMRLGHLVLEVADFQDTCAWYTNTFGFLPSDVQVLPDGSPVVVFMRLNLGATPADHHTLALAQGIRPAYSHAAFEVVDIDAVGMGQRVLRERGWRHAWGLGRHILGSQIFDYWQDAAGDKHEHYCDGDLFTEDVPMGVHAASRAAMSQWGPPMPASFTRPSFSPAAIAETAHHVRRSPDIDLKKLITLARLFG